jgi:hypothetical protein
MWGMEKREIMTTKIQINDEESLEISSKLTGIREVASRQYDVPLYGTICRTGKEWTVTLQDKTTPTGSTISGNISGYGPFPRDKYPDIPVVDFTGEPFDRCFDGLKLLDGGINQLVKNGEYPVDNLMNAYREHGFKVI